MEKQEETLRHELENKTYRYLQQTTKSLSLPSKFKKIHLIELIIARKLGLEDVVERIIDKAKQERLKTAEDRRQSKRKIVQDSQKHTTRGIVYSPPITATPRHSLLKRLNESPKDNSNRTLHSCHTRGTKRIMDIIKAHSSDGCIKIVNNKIPFELPRCTVKLHPSLRFTSVRRQNMKNSETIRSPARRERTISGIYPPIQNDIQIKGINLRSKDGTISSINAIVQRRTCERKKIQTYHVQDIINDVEQNLDSEDPILHGNEIDQNLSMTDSAFSEVNTISTISSTNDSTMEEKLFKYCENTLPTISQVFTRFNAVNNIDIMQPLQVQVSSEMERFPVNTLYVPQTNSYPILLESLYTFKNCLSNNTLLQVITKSNTKTVYSTTTVFSTEIDKILCRIIIYCICNKAMSICLFAYHRMAYRKVHPTSTVMQNAFSTYVPERQHQSEDNKRFASFLQCSEQEMQQDSVYSEEMNNSVSSMDTGDVGASVTIPEMVEDAFEIISQDGDYLERIGIDSTKVKCALCNWTGPTIIMECHIRKEHANQILKQTKPEWNITITLGSLVREQLWFNRIVEFNSAFYVLSAKYEDPDSITATLSLLSPDLVTHTASITIYNKVTGEPHSWQGDVEPMPPNLPCKNHLNGLKLKLASLDLLPNSANLSLVNGELVMDSPSKTVVGQPELNDIHIILFVKLD